MNNLQQSIVSQPSPGANHSVSVRPTGEHGFSRMSYSSGNNRRGTGRSKANRRCKTAEVSSERKQKAYQNAVDVYEERLHDAEARGLADLARHYTIEIEKYENLLRELSK